MTVFTAIWNTIEFQAHFILSDAQKVIFEIYLEDGNHQGTNTWIRQTPDANRYDASDGEVYTVTSDKAPVYAGYTFNPALGNVTHTYLHDDQTTWVFTLYYNTLPHKVIYKYVLSDGDTDQTPPEGATPLSTLNGTDGYRTYYTGQTLTVANDPTLAGWTFKGWFRSGNYGGTDLSGTSFPVENADITLVGTWEQVKRTVRFIDAETTDPGYANGARVNSNSPYTVYDNNLVSSAKTPNPATTLAELGVTSSESGTGYTLSGWDVIVNNAVVDSIGLSDPLSWTVLADTTFRAVWSHVWKVEYTRGLHGAFTDRTDGATSVKFDHIDQGAELSPNYDYSVKGSADDSTSNPDNVGNPTAADGWAFAGWGTTDGTNWTYYFAYDADANVDYGPGINVTGHAATPMPTNVTDNIEFVAFWKPLERFLVFSNLDYNGGTPTNYDPIPTISGETSIKVKSGSTPTLIADSAVTREGYKLVGWIDQNGTYTPGTTGEFVMPGLANGESWYLYPVFAVDTIEIKYESTNTSWGGVDNPQYSGPKTSVIGSTPNAYAGYEFDYWTRDDGATALGLADGVDADDNFKITPTVAGTYKAHFRAKTYTVTMQKDADDTVLPTEGESPSVTLPMTGTWADTITPSTASRPGYDFKGWDVYEKGEGEGVLGTKLHSRVTDANPFIKDLSNDSGSAEQLVLVPSFDKTVLGVIYHIGDGTWSNIAANFPDSEPASNGVAAPNAKIEHVIGNTVDLRLGNSATLAGYELVGWQDAETSPTHMYYFDAAAADDAGQSVETSFTMGATSVDLYPIWRPKSGYAVTFVDGVATGETPVTANTMPTDVSGKKWGDSIDLQKKDGAYSEPKRAGYEFEGWTVYASDYAVDPETGAVSGTVIGGTISESVTSKFFSELALSDTTANEHLYLVANWNELSKYSVVFNPGEGVTDAVMHAPYTNLKYSAGNIDTSAPTRPGYEFDGWTNSAGGSTEEKADNTYAALANGNDSVQTVTLTAKWLPKNNYKVIFDGNGEGETVDNMPTSPQQGLTWTGAVKTQNDNGNDPERAGYVFHGWIVKNSANTVLGGTDENPLSAGSTTFNMLAYNSDIDDNEELTLVAKWDPKVYSVTFDPNTAAGSTAVTGLPTNLPNLKYTDTDLDIHAPSRPGYEFGGWTSDKKSETIPAGEDTTAAFADLVSSDADLNVKLTAIWNALPDYNVYYSDNVPNGSVSYSGPIPDNKTGIGFDTAGIKQTELDSTQRPGFTFVGWDIVVTGTNTILATVTSGYSTDAKYSTIVGGDTSITSITYRAIWNGTPFKVTYKDIEGDEWVKANIGDSGAAVPNDPIDYLVESTVTPRGANTVLRAGYVLTGWQTVGDDAVQYLFVNNDGKFQMPNHDVNLYPVWDPMKYQVTFATGVGEGETAVTPGTMPENATNINFDTDVEHGEPTREGYDFGGWTVTRDDTTATVKDVGTGTSAYSVLVNGDATIAAITLTAYWTPKSFGVTYVLDESEVPMPKWESGNIKDSGKDAPKMLVGYVTDATVNLRETDTVSRAGYTLIGWKDSNDPNTSPHVYLFDENGHASFIQPAAKVFLYAVWDRNKAYKVTFDGNAPSNDPNEAAYIAPNAALGNMPNPNPQTNLQWDEAEGVVNPTVPTFTGYEFIGWKVYDSNGNPVVDKNGNQIVNGGTSTYFYILAGNVDSPEHKELTLVATWRKYTYKVVFVDNVDDGDTPVTANMPVDQDGLYFTSTVNHGAPTRVGYTFNGWSVLDITDDKNPHSLADVAVGDESSLYYELTGDPSNPTYRVLEFTVNWIEKQGYAVHFVPKPASDTGVTPVNGSDEAFHAAFPDKSGLYWDDTVTVYPAPTRTGYDFIRWAVQNTTDEGNPVSIGYVDASKIGNFKYSELARLRTDDAIMDITLTAVWKAHEWTVKYIVNQAAEGTGAWNKNNILDKGKATPDAAMTFKVDDAIDLRLPDTLTLAGYRLAGWQDAATNPTNIYYFDGADASAAGVANAATSFFMPDANVELFPVWIAKIYKVTFSENKPAEATETIQIVSNMPPTQWNDGDDGYPLKWIDSVSTIVNNKYPVLPGYEFTGWIIENATVTGAKTGKLLGPSYTFNDLAGNKDIAEHAVLNLIAQWEPAHYRVTYVDPIDANGAEVAVSNNTVIATNATLLWGDTVSIASPYDFTPAYTGKTDDDWQFDGWYVKDASGNLMLVKDTDSLVFSALAGRANMTIADSRSDDVLEPALIMYASWTRRVTFIVDYMTRPVEDGVPNTEAATLVGSAQVKGLDGDDIAVKWATTVLDMGQAHVVPGYEFNRGDSTPNMVGTLSAADAEPMHLVLYYDQLFGYQIVFDATPGKNASQQNTATVDAPAWNSPSTNYVPTDADWHYTGHKIDHWEYGVEGSMLTFPANGDATLTFEDIVRAIYGDDVDGTEGRVLGEDGKFLKPVTLYAVWVERNDYKVKYDNNYVAHSATTNSGITDGRFLERTEDATYTPGTKDNVVWSATDIEPTDTAQIVAPGVKAANKALYEIEGWNYLSKDGKQKPAEGLSFADIVKDMYADDQEPDNDTITLYARWKEILITLKYTPTMLQADSDGNLVLDSSGNVIEVGNGGGSVSRTSEVVSAVTGGTTSGTKLLAEGATATANPGYHFVGWRRVSDNTIVYAPGMNPATLSGQALLLAMATGGFNVLPDGTIDASSLYQVAQNTDDGYWHDEEYQALFAQNEIAILHYDKNATDATGSIADVEEPAGSLLTLSDGSAFKRTYWTLVSWNTKSDGTGTTYALAKTNWELPTGETTLFAMWQKNKATLKYAENGDGVTGTPESITDEWGTTHDVTSKVPTRKHYTFKGWNTAADGSGKSYKAGDDIELPGDGTTLYAMWELSKYTVKPTASRPTGGTVTGTPTDVEYGGHLPKDTITATPDPGYHLTGWKYTMTDEDGNVTTGYVSDPSELAIIGAVTFEPQFERDAETAATAGMPAAYGYGEGKYLAQTSDGLSVLVTTLVMLASGCLAMLFVAARRRREERQG